MTNKQVPWNKGMKMPPMSQESKDKISRANTGKNRGKRPYRWITGPDPIVQRLRRRWLLAKNQAKYWNQPWQISWDQYRDLLLDHEDQLGNRADAMNLCRTDKTEGWTIGNVTIMTQSQAGQRKKIRDSEGNVIRRTNTNGNKQQKRRNNENTI
tara:strand:+ start:175 stop:636 length:462 start_codon:yes stop_codon:yes gene_type:complete